MLKKSLIVVSFVLLTYSLLSCARAQDEMILDWNYSRNITDRQDIIEDVVVDSQNNIIVVGHDQPIATSSEWRIMKFDTNGILLWENITNISHSLDQAKAVTVDSQDNIIVVGFDTVVSSNYQWRIMKLKPDGGHIFDFPVNFSSGKDRAYDVAVDSQDNFIVVGSDYEPTNSQWRIMKFNSTGHSVWNLTFNPSTTGSDDAYGVAVDKNDNIIVVGRDRDTPGTYFQWRIMKFNSTGHSVWNYTNDLSDGYDEAQDVAVDSQDNIIVVGFDMNKTNEQWRIMKFTEDKTLLWNTSLNPSDIGDKAFAVAIDSNDDIIVVGYDKEIGNEQWRIIRINSTGDIIWNYPKNFDDSYDRAHAVANASNDDIIVVGYDTPDPSNLFDYQWRIMKFTFCGNSWVNSLEDCDYNAVDPDSTCLSYQSCNNVCQCRDLFNVWVEPNQMLFTVAQKTPINLYIKNTGDETDKYSVEVINPNPAIIDVDISGSSPTKPIDKGTTELVRPWITVLATITQEEITFNVTSFGNPEKYAIATLNVLEGLPISLHEFKILGLITMMILVGIVYFIVRTRKEYRF